MNAHLFLCLVACALQCAYADVDLITEPRPGEEYVLVSSGQQTPLRNFESSHKIPEKHPQHRALRDDAPDKVTKKLISGKTAPKHLAEGIVSIEEDKRILLKKGHKSKISESIEIDVPVSKLEDIRIKEKNADTDLNPKMAVDLETMSESGRLSGESGTTTQRPTLTTGAPAATTAAYDFVPVNFDSIDDINSGLLSSNVRLETAGSEQKQRSRIQIKKGPNGQDYEYEYIYYYYDDDEEPSSTAAPVHNAHDGPQKEEADNQIGKEGRSKSKYSTIERSATTTTAAPAAASVADQNEVLPTPSRGRTRGRNIPPAPVQEEVLEDRLPSSTRFPPRGRQLSGSSSTTYVPEAPEANRPRSRQETARPEAAQTAQPAQEEHNSRTRARAHIRRPSSELVDLDSFKTHSGDIPMQYKELPTRYSAESKTTTEHSEPATVSREGHRLPSGVRFQEILDDSKLPADYKTTTTPAEQDTTEYTTMTAMEKVALDLYAYLAGEKLNNEVNPSTVDLMSFDGTTTPAEEWTTEAATTTEDPTTTTTTTTPAPTTTTTTTTPAPSTRASRFKLRNNARPRPAAATSAATEPPAESSTKARGRFGKPKLGGRRSSTAAVEEPVSSTSAPEVNSATKAFGVRRGLASFGRGRTTASSSSTVSPAPAEPAAAASALKPDSNTKPTKQTRVPLRRITLPTVATAVTEASAAATSGDEPSSPRTLGRGNLRPLRPGTRLSLPRPGARGRPTSSTPAPEPANDAAPETVAPATEATPEQAAPSSTAAPEQRGAGSLRLRGRLVASPKPRVAVTPPARRPNPLIKRRKPSAAEPVPESEEATTTPLPSPTTAAATAESEPAAVEPSSTPAPAAPLRGLDALRARRRPPVRRDTAPATK